MHGRSKKAAHDKNLLNAIDVKVIFCELLKTGTINDGFSCSNFSDPVNLKRSENSNAGETNVRLFYIIHFSLSLINESARLCKKREMKQRKSVQLLLTLNLYFGCFFRCFKQRNKSDVDAATW